MKTNRKTKIARWMDSRKNDLRGEISEVQGPHRLGIIEKSRIPRNSGLKSQLNVSATNKNGVGGKEERCEAKTPGLSIIQAWKAMNVVKMVMIMTETSRKAKHRTLRNTRIWDGGKEKVTPKRYLQKELRIARGNLEKVMV